MDAREEADQRDGWIVLYIFQEESTFVLVRQLPTFGVGKGSEFFYSLPQKMFQFNSAYHSMSV